MKNANVTVEKIRMLNKTVVIKPSDFDPHFNHMKSKRFVKKLKQEIDDRLMVAERYLFIKRENNKVHGKCSHCGNLINLDKVPKNRTRIECDKCKSSLEVRNVKYSSFRDWNGKSYIRFDNSTLDKNIIVAYQYWVKRTIEGEFPEIEVIDNVAEEARYYFDMKSVPRMMVYSSWYKEWKFTKSLHQIYSNSLYGWDDYSLTNALKIAEDFKYLERGLFRESDPIKLLDFYIRHPDTEKLMKIGLNDLLQQYSLGTSTLGTINWNGKTITKQLKLNKREIKFFLENTRKEFHELYVLQSLKKLGLDIPSEYEAAHEIWSQNAIRDKNNFRDLISIDKPSRLLKYLENQRNQFPKKYRYLDSALRDFIDMITDMRKLEMKIEKRTIYPKNLDKKHQALANMIKVQNDELKNKLISKQVEGLMKYSISQEGYTIFPARSSEDLIKESKVLGHCVQNYIDRYSEGKTYIFLLRKEKDIEKPLYTIEVMHSNGKRLYVAQCRGKSNYDIPKEEVAAKSILSEFKLLLSGKKRSVSDEHRIAN